MKELNIKQESYPFDWIISDLIVKIDIIEDGFSNFLNLKNYDYVEDAPVYNITNSNYNIVAHENYFYNKFYGDNKNGLLY